MNQKKYADYDDGLAEEAGIVHIVVEDEARDSKGGQQHFSRLIAGGHRGVPAIPFSSTKLSTQPVQLRGSTD